VAWRRDDAEGARLRDQVRAAARQWDERGRPRGLLWRQEALAEYQLWRARYPGALTEVEEAFGRASANDAARGRRARRGIVVAIVLALGAGVIVLYQANRRARDSAAALHERLVDAHEEQGRQAFLAGDAERALLYFNEAHKQGRDTVALRYLVARAEEALVPKLPAFHHDDRVWSVAFSPDGKRVVTGSADRTARLWDVATGARALTLEHKDVVYAVAFSPDGTTLATASWDGSARLWDAATGALRHELGHAGRVYAVRFSRDGTRLVTPSRDATAKVWDAATGALVTTLAPHPAQVDDVDISPDGERILTACRDGAVRVWARDGRLAAVLPAGHGHVAVAAFSPDGARIVTVGDGSDAAVVWDAATGRELASLVHPNHVWDARWGPRGRLLTSSADGRARVWDVAAGTTMTVLEGHQGIVYAAAFTPDGTKIVTAGEDGTIRVWEVDVAKVTAVYEAGEVHLPLVMDPTGTHFVVGNVGAAQLWRMPDEKLHRTFRAHAGEAWTCAFSPDDARILTTGEDDALRVWDARTARLAGEMAFDRAPHTAGFSPDGRRAVVGFWLPTGARESTAVLSVVDLDARTRVLDLAGHTADVTHAEYSHDGARILSSSKDGTARIWDARSGAPLATIAAGESLAVARFSPDDRRALTGGAGATAALWDARDGRPLVRLEGHELAITLAAFSPDGAWALTGGNDKTAIVWDAATGRRAGSLVGHRSGLLWGEFTPDGQLAVTAARDGARIWDVATGRMLQALPHSGGVGGAAFSHDGRRLVVVSDDGTADVWETGVGPLDGLDRFVRCTVPLRLEAERIVPAAPICG
jgi:WD40 repeat protein